MKIGIVGPDTMARTWEHHLRRVSEMQEVIIAQRVEILNDVDACLILDDGSATDKASRQLIKALKNSYHVLWIAPLPTSPEVIANWHQAHEESGATVMLPMWAHYSPATRWLFNHIPRPAKIHIHREWSGPRFTPDTTTLQRIFLEEVSLCLEWNPGQPVRIEGDISLLPYDRQEKPGMRHVFIYFGNGTSASIFMNPFGLENRHSRFAGSDKIAAVCQVNQHLIKKWLLHVEHPDTPRILRFDYQEPAFHLLSHFIRSVKNGEEPLFGIHQWHALVTELRRFAHQ